MRIAMVSEHASPLAVLGGVDAGGQNVHVDALARELARRGVSVEVFTRRDDERLRERVQIAPGAAVEHVDAGPARPIPKDRLLPWMDDFAADLRRRLLANPPDLVHAHFWMSGLAATRAVRGLGIPVVLTFHALGIVKRREQGARDTSPPERLAVEQDLLRSVDQVISTCSDEAFELARLGLDPARASVVPCGVDLEVFSPGADAEPRPTGRRRLVVVTRLVQRKGVGNVIEALAEVPDTELVVAGGPESARLDEDPEAQRLVDLARRAGVEDRVDLRGAVPHDEIPRLLRSADVLVTVPWYEPFGIVPLEAMACGVPVVASAVGGLLDTVVDGVTGLHVPPRSPERLAEALRDLLDDDAALARMGRAATERARTYSWSRVAGSAIHVYRCLLSDRPAPMNWPGQVLEEARS